MDKATTEVAITNNWVDLSAGGSISSIIVQADNGRPVEIRLGTSSTPGASDRGHDLAKWDGNVFSIDGLAGEYVWARAAGEATMAVVTKG